MDIEDIVTQNFESYERDTPVSSVLSAFEDPEIKGIVVHGDEFDGVVTRRQLATSHRQPNEKVGSLVWHVPRLTPDEDIRTVAQLMIDSDSQVLPVFEGRSLVGVVTVDDLLQKVKPFLEAATVREAQSSELLTIEPSTTVGQTLSLFREQRITHLPVVDEGEAVGILSLYDLTDVSVRSMQQSQGGDAGGIDSFGGEISSRASSTRRGGFGAREGEGDRMLDLPVANVMESPVRTIDQNETLETAVDEMFDINGSSLVVTRGDRPVSIITKTDLLDALTWEAGGNRAVQVYGIDLLDDMQYDDVVSLIETFDDRDHGMTILDAKIHLHEHDERRRGTPLILARIRLHTDRDLFIASGEGYGASHAINEARDVMERQIRDRKTHAKSKKPRTEEFWEKRFGWTLEAAE